MGAGSCVVAHAHRGNAADGRGRTDYSVHTYDSHLKATHQREAMGVQRPGGPIASIAPDSLPEPDESTPAAGVVAVAFKPTTMPVWMRPSASLRSLALMRSTASESAN